LGAQQESLSADVTANGKLVVQSLMSFHGRWVSEFHLANLALEGSASVVEVHVQD